MSNDHEIFKIFSRYLQKLKNNIIIFTVSEYRLRIIIVQDNVEIMTSMVIDGYSSHLKTNRGSARIR